MKKIDLEQIILKNTNNRFLQIPQVFREIILFFLKKILYINQINSFINEHDHYGPKQFINELFDHLNFSFLISNSDIQKIPSEGKLICVANHPIGSLDSLSLLKAVLEIRSDVKIVANEILVNIDNLKPHLLPFRLDSKQMQRDNISSIHEALNKDFALIFFPAAEVSRLKWCRITDSKWHKGAIFFAKQHNVPILPVFIGARNSLLFYFASLLNKKLSTLLLAHELFNKKNKTIHIKIGDVIPAKAFSSSYINDIYQAKLLKKHVYQIGNNRKVIYTTEKNVIHPIERKIIKGELNNATLLGFTKDGMKIFLTTKHESPQIVNEIARLRELTFRKVGEGTGKRMDLDKFDNYYSHLVVWNEHELDIVGAYRLGIGNSILEKYGKDGFYTSTLFDYSADFINNYLPNSIELGRSFVQKQYWNTNALNYLWQGIGAFLSNYPSVKYLFGGVSISNNYTEYVKELITFYFEKWYSDDSKLVSSKRKFIITKTNQNEYKELFTSTTAKEDYKILKKIIKPLGFSIPILYKHYADLCEEKGVKFLDFGVDPDFENCIDGLILVDVSLIKEEKREKFIKSNFQTDLKESA